MADELDQFTPADWTGAAIQAGSDVASSALGAIFAKKSAKKQFSRQVYAYQNRYQWTMADMRKAGLNPILAAGQGAGSAPTASMAARSGGTSDYAGAISKSKRLKGEMALLDAQTSATTADAVKSADQAALYAEQKYQTKQITQQIRELHPHAVNSAAANARMNKAGVPLAELDANFYLGKGGATARQIQRYLESVPGGLSIFKNLVGGRPGKRGGKRGGRR